MPIAMIDTGYVGLSSDACFSEFGVHVCCIDARRLRLAGRGRLRGPADGVERVPRAEPGAGRDIAERLVMVNLHKVHTPAIMTKAGFAYTSIGRPS
ncbi:hypothetical protein [Azospirillum sp. SYSU D00513]|uniref:hypothetical protein n=1 Tax=Azospirillum sp. SYSU D00513 TaxID=2812561 RepID=UPI001FFF674D|nr:hypothetical protein [Azospirillum sp. SYSU D00513]